MSAPYASVSIICVYNDPTVRQRCLDESIQMLDDEASDIEYLPIDNVDGVYPSAGAALNRGASLAKNDVVVFVHQDVFLHSLASLKKAAGQILMENFGLLGAVGIQSDGRIIGRVRDRVVLLGEPATCPTDVDTIDEVLFLVPRSQLLREPLMESSDFAWHAYAVEYGLRMRKRGLRTGVTDIPLTHNSLSTNLDRLAEAHQAIATRYADLLPVRTTCGLIRSKTARTDSRVWFPSHRWRYRWLRESITLRGTRKNTRLKDAVLADIRLDVDDVIDLSPGRRLHIINNSEGRRFADGGPLKLSRRNGDVVITDYDILEVPTALDAHHGSWLLLTNLSSRDLKMISSWSSASRGVLGFHTGIGFWLLLGDRFIDLPPQWRSKKAIPMGMRALSSPTG